MTNKMICPKCGSELRVWTENDQVQINEHFDYICSNENDFSSKFTKDESILLQALKRKYKKVNSNDFSIPKIIKNIEELKTWARNIANNGEYIFDDRKVNSHYGYRILKEIEANTLLNF